MQGLLDGKSVVITGAGSAVGRAAAKLFAQHGARLVCADSYASDVGETVELIRSSGGEALAFFGDIADQTEAKRAIDAAVNAFGQLHVMCNSVSDAPIRSRCLNYIQNDYPASHHVPGAKLRSVENGSRAAVAQFRAQGAGGTIVNTTSVLGVFRSDGSVSGAAEGRIVDFTRGLAKEVAADGIRVNIVCCGAIYKDVMHGGGLAVPDDGAAVLKTLHPLRGELRAIDCANGALFLASDLAANVTGAVLPVDGGLTGAR